MKNLLLMDERVASPDNADIWRTAIRRGWTVERTNPFKIKEHIGDHKFVRYYGNTLHAKMIEGLLPLKLSPIDYSILPSLQEYTKRFISFVSFKRLIQPIEHTLFIKPARDKWFEAKVYHPGNTISGSPMDGDEIYISEVVKFINEVRCFVVDGEVLTSSLYRINTEVWDRVTEDPEKINFDGRIKDTDIPRMVKEIHSKYKNQLPRGVVMDFGTIESSCRPAADEYSLVEFNEAWSCGLYYTNYDKAFDCIIASQENL